jgi:hypothetical protein
MIAFQVAVNGSEVCTAGISDFGVVSAIVTWVRRTRAKSTDGKSIEEELTFDVGGLDSAAGEHLNWFRTTLNVGDTVTVWILDNAHVDAPGERRKEDPQEVARAQRRYYERLKREYGE